METGYEAGLSKSQVANILSPLEAIEEYTGLQGGGIKANFYGDCAMIPDPSELDVMEKNLVILDDSFLGPQSGSVPHMG